MIQRATCLIYDHATNLPDGGIFDISRATNPEPSSRKGVEAFLQHAELQDKRVLAQDLYHDKPAHENQEHLGKDPYEPPHIPWGQFQRKVG